MPTLLPRAMRVNRSMNRSTCSATRSVSGTVAICSMTPVRRRTGSDFGSSSKSRTVPAGGRVSASSRDDVTNVSRAEGCETVRA